MAERFRMKRLKAKDKDFNFSDPCLLYSVFFILKSFLSLLHAVVPQHAWGSFS